MSPIFRPPRVHSSGVRPAHSTTGSGVRPTTVAGVRPATAAGPTLRPPVTGPAPAASAARPPHVIERCRGVQVGDRTTQVNTYEFRVDRARVDLEKELRRRAVRESLATLAADPYDAAKQKAADKVLAAGRVFAPRPEVTVGARPRSTSSSTTTGTWNCLVVRDSEGVQLGDGSRQRNHFVYATTARMDGREVLARSPELREALIAECCGRSGGDEVRTELARAVDDAVAGSSRARELGTRVPSDRWTVVVRDRDGVSYGRSSRQENHLAVSTRATALPTFPPHHLRPADPR